MSGVKSAVVVGKVELKPQQPKYTGPRPIKTYDNERPVKVVGPKGVGGRKPNKAPEKPATQSQMLAELQYLKKQLRDAREALAAESREKQSLLRQLQAVGVGLP